jgi:putative sugar O-methyltransferase
LSILGFLKTAREDGQLMPVVTSWLKASAYVVVDPTRGLVRLHAPPLVEPDPADLPLVRRILASYRVMKDGQEKAGELYKPSSLWQQQLDVAYYPLNSGTEGEAHRFLANFGNWPKFTGITWSTLVRDSTKSLLKTRHLESLFRTQLRVWNFYNVDRKPLSALEHPHFGNQAGAYIKDTFVNLQSFPAETYGSIAAGILAGLERPVLAELGSGYGPIAHYALKHLPSSCYVAFDLPETLCLCAYFQAKVNPRKSLLLYGEEPYSPEAHKRFDFVFMPSFEMASLEPGSVGLFLNTSSLGEMTRAAATNYIGQIARSTRYFLHLNHDRLRNTYADGETSLLGSEYPVPAESFALLYRYPDLFHMTNRGFVNFGSESFIYLYGRR